MLIAIGVAAYVGFLLVAVLAIWAAEEFRKGVGGAAYTATRDRS